MTVQQIFNSLPIVNKLTELKLPIKKAYEIYSLVKKLEEQRVFFAQEEQKMVSKFNAQIMENGNIRFNTAEDQKGFTQEHAELMQFEIAEIAAVELKFSDLGDEPFSPKEIMMLEGVVNFVE